MGYQQKDVTDGVYNFMTATFDKLSGTYTLGDIGVNSDFVYSTLSFLDENAATKSFTIDGFAVDQFYYYFAADLDGTAFEGQPGWYFVDDDAGDLHSANSIPVPYGSTFYIEGQEDGAQIVFAGSVSDTDIPVDVEDGVYNFMGNCTPVNLTLGDITVNDAFVYSTLSFLDENAATKSFTIDGFTVDQFFYYFEADLDGTAFEGQPGWYFVDDDAGDLHSANSIPVNAGDTFYIEGQDDGAQVIIPSAL